MVVGAVSALVIAARAMPRPAPGAAPSPPTSVRRRLAFVLAVIALAVVDAGAVLGLPYGNGYQPRHTPALVRVSGLPTASYPGGMVNYRVDITNTSDVVFLTGVVLTITLAPGMHLVGPPKVEIGTGCNGGETVIRCPLGYLSAGQPTTVWFGIQFSESGLHRLRARVSSNGFEGPPATEYDVLVGT
jgi:hypothetical protein